MNKLLFQSLGQKRTKLLWHGFGFTLLLGHLYFMLWPAKLGLMSYLSFSELLSYHAGRFPISFIYSFFLSLFLLFLGARALLVFLSFPIIAWTFYDTILNFDRFPAVEFPLLLAIPAFSVLSVLVCHSSPHSAKSQALEIEKSHVSFVKLLLLSSLFFVSFHKVNADFFNPEVSCALQLGGWFAEGWGKSGEMLTSVLSPLLIVATEGLAILLLLLVPEIGILITSMLMITFGMTGATQISFLVILLSLFFLKKEAFELFFHRIGMIFLGALVLTGAAGYLMLNLYTGNVLAPVEIILYLFGVVLAWSVVFCSLLASPENPTSSLLSKCPSRIREVLPSAKSAKLLLVASFLLLVLNGFSPYFGFKFHYSLSMWSNLRVDSHRWNSYLIPEWFRIHDPLKHYLEVKELDVERAQVLLMKEKIVSTGQLYEQVRPFSNDIVNITFTFDDILYEYPDIFQNNAFTEMLTIMGNQRRMQKDKGLRPSPVFVHEILAEINPTEHLESGQFTYPTALSDYLKSFETAEETLVDYGKMTKEADFDVKLHYQGKDYSFENARKNPEFHSFRENLAKLNIFQKKLSKHRPQKCEH